jgi:hypothetical protein
MLRGTTDNSCSQGVWETIHKSVNRKYQRIYRPFQNKCKSGAGNDLALMTFYFTKRYVI